MQHGGEYLRRFYFMDLSVVDLEIFDEGTQKTVAYGPVGVFSVFLVEEMRQVAAFRHGKFVLAVEGVFHEPAF